MVVGSWLWTVGEPERAWRPADAPALALTVAVNLPLALRRRLPWTVLVVSTTAATLLHLLGYHSVTNNMGPLLALYTVAARRSWRWTAAGALLVTAEWTYALVSAAAVPQPLWSALGQALMVSATATAMGTTARLLAQRAAELAELADRLHRQQEIVAERTVIRERMQIARELHDVVAHHMSIIAVQANLGRYVADSDPATARQTLEVIADTSHQALAEMRRLLSVLRLEAGEESLYTSAPGLRHLPSLVERMSRAGLRIELQVRGPARDLPSGLDLCVYRIVQESLTNTLKHAGRAQVGVVLDYTPATVSVRVRDDGARAAGLPPDDGGHGLIGMTERVKLYHGSIITGRRPQGGYEVIATFPLSEPADDGPRALPACRESHDHGTRGR